MIAADKDPPDDPLSLEVLAVIVTSEGDYSRGLRLWEHLLQRDPQHTEAKRMVPAIQLWLSRPSWIQYVPAFAASLFAIFVIVAFWALTREPARVMTPRKTTPASASPVAAPSDRTAVQPSQAQPSQTLELGSSPPASAVKLPPKKQQRPR